ncbi:hypothetical protein BDK51DRAFT_38104 [Blyttiomyces helicus]|uniref:Uncharacterized protein n=1 Tax=Blyttiomyces helicus TaxID=388810 RepID=A0A4P9WN44_9FUNG|nr:hypothetical protein BDK51DRAFT_38104 [Blyttiomyces helicus]|eukprot:RKO92630.1 hypothetical protein BDK51DRAFT_38104 [Blyttiomyces helicus]
MTDPLPLLHMAGANIKLSSFLPPDELIDLQARTELIQSNPAPATKWIIVCWEIFFRKFSRYDVSNGRLFWAPRHHQHTTQACICSARCDHQICTPDEREFWLPTEIAGMGVGSAQCVPKVLSNGYAHLSVLLSTFDLPTASQDFIAPVNVWEVLSTANPKCPFLWHPVYPEHKHNYWCTGKDIKCSLQSSVATPRFYATTTKIQILPLKSDKNSVKHNDEIMHVFRRNTCVQSGTKEAYCWTVSMYRAVNKTIELAAPHTWNLLAKKKAFFSSNDFVHLKFQDTLEIRTPFEYRYIHNSSFKVDDDFTLDFHNDNFRHTNISVVYKYRPQLLYDNRISLMDNLMQFRKVGLHFRLEVVCMYAAHPRHMMRGIALRKQLHSHVYLTKNPDPDKSKEQAAALCILLCSPWPFPKPSAEHQRHTQRPGKTPTSTERQTRRSAPPELLPPSSRSTTATMNDKDSDGSHVLADPSAIKLTPYGAIDFNAMIPLSTKEKEKTLTTLRVSIASEDRSLFATAADTEPPFLVSPEAAIKSLKELNTADFLEKLPESTCKALYINLFIPVKEINILAAALALQDPPLDTDQQDVLLIFCHHILTAF